MASATVVTLLYNRCTDHTENIFDYIVDTCVLSHCIATVATLPLLLYWAVSYHCLVIHVTLLPL
jgi:hypothetical protein